LGFGRRVAGDHDVRLLRPYDPGGGFAVSNVVEPSLHERGLVIGAGEGNPGKSKPGGIRRRPLQLPFWAEVAAKIKMRDGVSPSSKFPAEVCLERVTCVVVDDYSQRSQSLN
jgi:hypothetical protein